jgi:hypothetical protein
MGAVIPFPQAHRFGSGDGTPPTDQEVTVAVMEEHIATMEKAMLAMAYSLQRQRTLLEELKAQNGWKFKIPAPASMFGDAVLFRECALQIVKRKGGEA